MISNVNYKLLKISFKKQIKYLNLPKTQEIN